MKNTLLFQILFFSFFASSCISFSSDRAVPTISSIPPAHATNTSVAEKTPTTLPTASITPAVINKPGIHYLALNEINIDEIENLAKFGAPNDSCLISSQVDSALETRLVNGQLEYLLASKDRENNNILIWNIETRTITQILIETDSNSVLFSPDQKTLITFSNSDTSTLILWDIQSGSQQITYKLNGYYDDRISISQDGLRIGLFSGNSYVEDWQISEFNLQTNQINDTDYDFPLYRETPPPHVYSSKGNLVAVTYAKDDKLQLLDLTNNKDTVLQFPFRNLEEVGLAEAFVSTLSVSANEKYVAGGTLGGDIYIWSFADGSLLRVFKAHETNMADGWIGGVKILEFSPESNLLLSVGYDGFTKLWVTGEDNALKEIDTCHTFGGFTQDGRYLVLVGKNGVEIWGIP